MLNDERWANWRNRLTDDVGGKKKLGFVLGCYIFLLLPLFANLTNFVAHFCLNIAESTENFSVVLQKTLMFLQYQTVVPVKYSHILLAKIKPPFQKFNLCSNLFSRHKVSFIMLVFSIFLKEGKSKALENSQTWFDQTFRAVALGIDGNFILLKIYAMFVKII